MATRPSRVAKSWGQHNNGNGHTQTSISTSICTEPPHLIHDDEDDADESDDEEDEEDKENEEDEGDGAGWEV